MSRIKFMCTEIDNLTMNEALERIEEFIKEDKSKFVVTANVDHIVQLDKGGELTKAYEHADMILADGQPLIWISRWYKTPIKEKISGSDLFPKLCALAAAKGYRMYFLGAANGVAAQAAKNLEKKFPGLQVCDTYSPPKGFENDEAEIEKIIRQIKDAAPQILIMGLGTPKQELFIFNNKDELGVPVSLGLGASLDFEAGRLKRAPRWMSASGLEWFYRVLQDPRRLAKRYLVDDTKILGLIFKYRPGARKRA
ncbi:MAG: WecB/TagA/CpsF family glycosyltransferase [Lachnospiraceae bacterium]|nr:WecB/TagA/CpsF family glycosyltransferase [Lachnospiraceae bacterium]